MKIYIVNLLPQSLKNKMDKLLDSDIFGCITESIKYEICSKEFGIQILEDEKIRQLESTFTPNYEYIKGYTPLYKGQGCNEYNLLVDQTEYNIVPIVSQLPTEYILTKYHILKIKETKKSQLALVVERLEEIDKFEKWKDPVNFYFEYNGTKLDLSDPFFQDNLNVFLSVLN